MQKLLFFFLFILCYCFGFSCETTEISFNFDEKIYVLPEKVQVTANGIVLNLSSQNKVPLPVLLTDERGCYVPMNLFSDYISEYAQYVMCPYCHAYPIPFPALYGSSCPICYRTLYPSDFY